MLELAIGRMVVHPWNVECYRITNDPAFNTGKVVPAIITFGSQTESDAVCYTAVISAKV